MDQLRTGFSLRTGGLLAVLISLIAAGRAQAQLDATEAELEHKYGHLVSVAPLPGADRMLECTVPGAPGRVVRFGLVDGRVAFIVCRGLIEQCEIDRILVEAVPVPEKTTGVRPRWERDVRQTAIYPALGATATATRPIPGTERITGESLRWTEIYDQWGRLVGSSPPRIVPNVSSYKLRYRYLNLKVRIPVLRSDGAACALYELSDRTASGRLATNEVVIASADRYWHWRFAEFRKLEQRPPSFRRYPLSVYELDPDDRYDDALFGHLTPDVAAQVLRSWRLATMLAAVDSSGISELESLEFFVDDCGRDALRTELMHGIGRLLPPIRIRHALMLDHIGSLDAVPSVITLLKRPQTAPDALHCLRTIAKRHGDLAAAELDAEPRLWRQWYQSAKVGAKPASK